MLYRYPNNGTKGRGGGVGVAFYTDDPNSNPSEDYSFSVKCCLKRTKTNKPEAEVGSFLKKSNGTNVSGIDHNYSEAS